VTVFQIFLWVYLGSWLLVFVGIPLSFVLDHLARTDRMEE